MWAKIEPEGTIVAGHGATSVHWDERGEYVVGFERDLTNCAVVATQNGEDLTSVVHDAITKPSLGSNNAVVFILDQLGKETPARFSIVAVC